MYSFGVVLKREEFTRTNTEKFAFIYQNMRGLLGFFNFKQLRHTTIHAISYLSQLLSLPHATHHLLQELCGISNFLASFHHLTKPFHSIFHPQINVYRSSSELFLCEALYLLSINRFRSSIMHCLNRKLQSISTLQSNGHNPLLGPEISQRIRSCRGTFPMTQTYSDHTGMFPS